MKKTFLLFTILVALLSSLFLPRVVEGQEINTLSIVKLENVTSTHSIHAIPDEKTQAVSGTSYQIWRLGDANPESTQADYDQLLNVINQKTHKELTAEFTSISSQIGTPTDTDGKTVFTNLPEGRYYVRESESNDAIPKSERVNSVPFIVDLPLTTVTGLLHNVTVYPKTDTPEKPEKPTTGGYKFIKVDENDKPLAGAKFKVVQRVLDADGKEAKDSRGNPIYQPVMKDKNELILTSASDGRFEINGLPYGKYWLVETVSPPGYTLLAEPLVFDITKDSYSEKTVLKIINRSKPKTPTKTTKIPPSKTPGRVVIPQTGDGLIVLLIALGTSFILFGYWLTRKSSKQI